MITLGLHRYVRLARVDGARPLMVFSALARLGAAMIGVGVIAMIAFRDNGFDTAGIVTAAGLASLGVCGPFVGRFMDRVRGGAWVFAACAASTASLLLVTWLSFTHAPAYVLAIAYIPFGVQPQLGGLVRARWVERLGSDRKAVHTANAYEQIVEESCYLIGPALSGGLAAWFFPEAGTLVAAALFLIGAAGFAFLVNHERRPDDDHVQDPNRPARRPLSDVRLLGLAVSTGLLGGVFGSYDVLAVAYGDQAGARGVGGMLIAVFAVGSLIGGLVNGAYASARHPSRRLAGCLLGLCVSLAFAPFAQTILLQCVVAFGAGLFVAPSLAASMTWAQQIVRRDSLVEGMAIVTTAIMFGVSISAWIAGLAATALSLPHAFLLSLGFAVLSLSGCLVCRRLMGVPR
ncbi:MFS transporter [Actinosynnema sp. NPDC050801]|uniref:MFS transporter n=1 Tax=unclassified Actinosynnema TaxID=2637065 RepID=UPI0033D147A0